MIKKFNYLIQAVLISIFFILARLIGLRLSRKLFSAIFINVAPIFKSKKIINKNLEILSKKNPVLDKERIISNMWSNYGMTFVEYIFLNQFRKNNSQIEIEGEKNLENLISKYKKVIFVSGHFANYELMSMEITRKKIKLATIYRPLNNFFLNPLMEFLRRRYVCKFQIKKGIRGVRESIEYLKKDFSIALMIDQRVSEGEKINFFDRPAFTTTLPAQLAIKFNLPIVPVYIERKINNNFRIKFFKELNPLNFKNKLEITNRLNLILEEMVLRNPSQWIWTHNRWK